MVLLKLNEDEILLSAECSQECKIHAFETAIETNGTIAINLDLHWIWSLIIWIFSPWMALRAKKIQGRPFSIALRTLGGNLAFINTN